ncbi:MAG: hypothetical protein EAY75_04520 [Bacteroidetes bacterium]|nr:MAG: hypothetical protein EAY75_04520 [Bacteroidota bacterium]
MAPQSSSCQPQLGHKTLGDGIGCLALWHSQTPVVALHFRGWHISKNRSQWVLAAVGLGAPFSGPGGLKFGGQFCSGWALRGVCHGRHIGGRY